MLRRDFLRTAAVMAGMTASGAVCWADDTDGTVDVRTNAGTLRGRVAADGTRRFFGVPFAKPPVGPLRFRAPEPAAPWDGVRECFKSAVAPIQSGKKPEEMSEDCLYLNVWAPKGQGPFPVFAWVHGGANTGGWNGEAQYDGTEFARSGVICVNLSYRLGAFGFLELGELLGPEYKGSGNNGLRDLVLGLRWIKENIAAFGGDPRRITVAGQSAGAKDVAALLGSPATAGLLRGAIMESGSGQTVHVLDDAQDVARRLLTAMGIASGDAGRLRDAPAADLLHAQEKMSGPYPHAFPFRAVVDGDFLRQRPVDAIAAGSAKDVALLIGTNKDESLVFFPAEAASKPIEGREIANTPLANVQQAETRFRGLFPEATDLDRRVRLLTAEEYWVPSIHVAEGHAASGGRTWMYRFEHAPKEGGHAGRTVHSAEMPFVWGNIPAGWSASDHALSRALHGAWVAFVRDGKPRSAGLPDWPEYDAARRRTMILTDPASSVVEDPSSAERTLWGGLV